MSISDPPDGVFVCKFEVSGDKGTYHLSFRISEEIIDTTCSCRKGKSRKPCWHCNYVLAGKTSRIIGGDFQLQHELIRRMEHTKEGKRLLLAARKKFAEETRCRRCNSERIVKVKNSLWAQLFTMFRESRHAYFCKDCKWTW
jgi:DNA-directed RNA polymerase subunit RPC12/RpoP